MGVFSPKSFKLMKENIDTMLAKGFTSQIIQITDNESFDGKYILNESNTKEITT